MKTFQNTVSGVSSDFPLTRIEDPERILWLDIETTGLSPKNSCIYMIGCAYFRDGEYRMIRFLAEDVAEEAQLITEFFQFVFPFTVLITYNGNSFDIPFLQARCSFYDLPYTFENFSGIDLYKQIRPYQRMFSLPDLKQQTVEQFLQTGRKDDRSGGELIGVYAEFTERPSDYALNILLQHNEDDVKGLIHLTSLLSYHHLFSNPPQIQKAFTNRYKDIQGQERLELIVEFTFSTPIPKPFSFGYSDCYLMAGGNCGKLRVAVTMGVMKHFYSDYTDYYYLPEEDRAIHKSVGAFVDRQHRIPAKASTCYIKKRGYYLPEWEEIVSPVFYREYRDQTMYFELTEGFKNDSELLSRYLSHLMLVLLQDSVKA